MKKLTVLVALVALGVASMAQTLNVKSAYESWQRGYYKKAKEQIDLAAAHEQTKGEAITWYYRTMIYTTIGTEIMANPATKTAKELKTINELKALVPCWYREALISWSNWKQLDKDGEYAKKINTLCPHIGDAYYGAAADCYENNDFENAMHLCDTAIMMFNEDSQNNKKYLENAYYLGGLAALVSKDTANIVSYFNHLVVGPSSLRINDVTNAYENLFNIHVAQKDTNKAVNIAKKFRANQKEAYQADLLMMRAHLLKGNMEKGQECLNAALAKADQDSKPSLLCTAGSISELMGNFDAATDFFNQSLQMKPNQFEANYDMGKMLYNRGYDKLKAINDVPLDDETGLSEKLEEEYKALFNQAIPYLKAAIAFIDALPQDQQKYQVANLLGCLRSLSTIYSRVNMYDEVNALKPRIESIEKGQ